MYCILIIYLLCENLFYLQINNYAIKTLLQNKFSVICHENLLNSPVTKQTVSDLGGGGQVGILAPDAVGIRALLSVDNPHTNTM